MDEPRHQDTLQQHFIVARLKQKNFGKNCRVSVGQRLILGNLLQGPIRNQFNDKLKQQASKPFDVEMILSQHHLKQQQKKLNENLPLMAYTMEVTSCWF